MLLIELRLSSLATYHVPAPSISPSVDQSFSNLAWLGTGYKLRPMGAKLTLDLQKVEGKREDAVLSS